MFLVVAASDHMFKKEIWDKLTEFLGKVQSDPQENGVTWP